jgi:hypothetical protein
MPSHLLVPVGNLKQWHLLFKRHRPRIARAIRGAPMHYIAEDLDMDSWVKAGLARLERYLACWGLFIELYPADPL